MAARRAGCNSWLGNRGYDLWIGLRPICYNASQPMDHNGTPTMSDVQIETAPGRRLAVVPHKGPYPGIGAAFATVGDHVTRAGAWPDVTGMVAVYLDNPDVVAPDDLRSYAGVELAPDDDIPEGCEAYEIAPGRVARLRHVGPYTGLHAAYGMLYGGWFPTSGQAPADHPSYEVYLNSPTNTAPADLISDIYQPLAD